MDEINFNYDIYTKGFNLGWEAYQKSPETYELLLKAVKEPKELVTGIKEARQEFIKLNEQPEKKSKDKGMERK